MAGSCLSLGGGVGHLVRRVDAARPDISGPINPPPLDRSRVDSATSGPSYCHTPRPRAGSRGRARTRRDPSAQGGTHRLLAAPPVHGEGWDGTAAVRVFPTSPSFAGLLHGFAHGYDLGVPGLLPPSRQAESSVARSRHSPRGTRRWVQRPLQPPPSIRRARRRAVKWHRARRPSPSTVLEDGPRARGAGGSAPVRRRKIPGFGTSPPGAELSSGGHQSKNPSPPFPVHGSDQEGSAGRSRLGTTAGPGRPILVGHRRL